eukprot:463576-Rhodomonas_salina.2
MVYFCRQAQKTVLTRGYAGTRHGCAATQRTLSRYTARAERGGLGTASLLWPYAPPSTCPVSDADQLGHRRCALDALELFTFRRTQNYDPELGVDGTYNNFLTTEKCNQSHSTASTNLGPSSVATKEQPRIIAMPVLNLGYGATRLWRGRVRSDTCTT